MSRKKSAREWTMPRSRSCDSTAQPAPSMSIPPRPTKWPNSCASRAGQAGSGSTRGRRPRPGRPACRRPGRSPASRTRARRRPSLDDRADDLGDDVAGLLEDDPVADPDVLAPDLVEVVERRPRDGRAGDLGRRQVGDRRQRPRPPDVRHDVLEERLDLLGRELEGDRPARRPADHPEARLLVEPVDLDDDAVGLVRQLVARLAPALGEVDDALDVEPRLVLRVDREAQRGEPLERGRLRRDRVAVLDQLVEPGRQLPAGGDRRVDLAERARAAVARVGVERQPGLLALLVDPLELGLGHEDLAARLERGGLAPGAPGSTAIVRRLAVTSSPVVPSPRVAPWTNRPRS